MFLMSCVIESFLIIIARLIIYIDRINKTFTIHRDSMLAFFVTNFKKLNMLYSPHSFIVYFG